MYLCGDSFTQQACSNQIPSSVSASDKDLFDSGQYASNMWFLSYPRSAVQYITRTTRLSMITSQDWSASCIWNLLMSSNHGMVRVSLHSNISWVNQSLQHLTMRRYAIFSVNIFSCFIMWGSGASPLANSFLMSYMKSRYQLINCAPCKRRIVTNIACSVKIWQIWLYDFILVTHCLSDMACCS